jgi:pentatricopeptide repeat protein
MQALFAQLASEPFYRLINLLAQMGRTEEAFEVAERMRAQALLELIRFASLLEREPTTNQTDSEYQAFQTAHHRTGRATCRGVVKPQAKLGACQPTEARVSICTR